MGQAPRRVSIHAPVRERLDLHTHDAHRYDVSIHAPVRERLWLLATL